MRRRDRRPVWLLCGLAVVAAACGGCREWKSYVRLTPPSAEWTHDEQDLPEEYVWRTDGATVRAWSVGDARPFRCSGDSPDKSSIGATLKISYPNREHIMIEDGN